MSLNKLIGELATAALTRHDAETGFRAMAARGSKKERVRLLARLDRTFASRAGRR